MIHFKKWTHKPFGAFNSLHKTVKICTLAMAYTMVAEPAQVNAQVLQPKDTTAIEIDEVVVQGAPISQQVLETGRQIQVIKGRDLQELPATSVEEIIQRVAGLETQSRNAFGVQTDFSLRGSTFQQVLVLIDGLRINDPMTAHFNGNIPVAPSEIEQIEIIQGPATAEYGPDAVGGVINIITKTFSQQVHEKGIKADAKILYGQNNLYSGNGGIFYENNLLKASVGILHNQSDGQTFGNLAPTRFDVSTYSAGIGYKLPANWQLAIRGAYDLRDFNTQYFYSFSPKDSANENLTRKWAQARVSHKGTNSYTKIDGGYLSTLDNYIFNPAMISILPAYKNTMQLFVFNGSHTIVLNNQIELMLGAQANQRGIESNNRGNHKVWHYGAFVSSKFKPVSNITINGTLREDNDEIYGTSLLPQLSASYQPTNIINLRLAAGRSVRTPDFTELYYQRYGLGAGKTLGEGNKVGNPNLKPEDSWSVEMGGDLFLPIGLRFSTTGFYRISDNLIDYVLTNSSKLDSLSFLKYQTNYLYAQNIAKAKILGISSECSYSHKFNDIVSMNYQINFTYQKSSNEKGIISFYIANHAQQILNNQLNLQVGPIRWFVDNKYVVRDAHSTTEISQKYKYIRLQSEYQVWNTQLEATIIAKKVWANIQVNNVFNTEYQAIMGPNMPKRWIMGGMRLAL